ncbi:MAG TPA: glycosyltransferase family 39 protein, partial [Pyrinomonadaceae bacterium]
MPKFNRPGEAAALSGMLLAFVFVLLLLLSQKGLFIDDSMHIPAGYSYLLTHDYRLNQEHPPLIKLLSGSGVWKLQPHFPFESPGWQQAATPEDPDDGMERIEEAFFDTNAKQFEQIAFYGRLPMLVIPLLLFVAVWWFTRQLFGPIAALLAVFLMATEPNVIGNSIVVQNDIASALALLLFVIALKKFVTDGAASAPSEHRMKSTVGAALRG